MKHSQKYARSGVDYTLSDPAKILAQKEGRKTAKNLSNFREVAESRGESAYVLDAGDHYLAVTQEGLGTKNLVADVMYQKTGKTFYQHIAQDAVATIINDLITVGAKPLVLNAYWSMQSYSWFTDKKKTSDLIKGWRKACDKAGVVWGGGETQSLSDIVQKSVIELAGSALGIVKPKSRLSLGKKLRAGDAIILLESSGIHANGLSLARKIAAKLPRGYLTRLPSGRTFGEVLLDPSLIYAKLIQELFDSNIDIHYLAHITGHGWRKIMRHKKAFTYEFTAIPPVPEVFTFIQKQAHMSDEEAYSTFNMGAGLAIFVPQKDVRRVIQISRKYKIKAYNTGVVKPGKKQVIIKPKSVIFGVESLQVRA